MGLAARKLRMAAAGGGGSFSPDDIAGLVAWYDADDAATITDAGSGAVSQWDDKSGNAYHVTQGTSGLRPTTGTRTINSLNAIDFDGSDDVLKSANITTAQPVTVFMVLLSDNPDTNNRQALGNGGTSPTVYTQGGFWRMFAGADLASSTAPDTSAHTISAVFNSTSSVLYLDGASIASGNVGTDGWSVKPISLGSDSAESTRWNGLIAEVVIYDSALGSTDRQSVEDYLATKWGTP